MTTWGMVARKVACLMAVTLVLGMAFAAQAADRQPLLMDGKHTLFQRVIVHPGAQLVNAAGGSQVVAQVPAFTPLYVYQRSGDWLEVGPTAKAATGWIDTGHTSEWKQALTLVFGPRNGRLPVLFYKDRARLEQVGGSRDSAAQTRALAEKAAAIKAGHTAEPADWPLIAAEPVDNAVAYDRFYLLPIFQTAEPFVGVKLLQVASIDPGTGAAPKVAADTPAPANAGDLKTGIVFVMDTTMSMSRYFQRSQDVVRRVWAAVDQAGLSNKVAFGLVAFRNNTNATPGLGYTVQKVSDLVESSHHADFEQALASLSEATVSSHSYDEDAFAGVKAAIEQMNWGPYRARVIFLITDAGALRNDDPYSSTQMNEAELNARAKANDIHIFAFHLRTPAGAHLRNGRNDHDSAEQQYRALTAESAPGESNYIGVPGGDPDAFSRAVEATARGMVSLVRTTAAGQRMPDAPPPPAGDSPEDQAARRAAALGLAMQLDFFGAHTGTRAPEVKVGWVADKDIADPNKPTFDVCVLMNKYQLDQLRQTVDTVLEKAVVSHRTGSQDLFQQIMAAAAQMSRDPAQFRDHPLDTLGGVLPEYIADLPYKSAIMRLSQDDWNRMSVGEQTAFINTLRSKVWLYQGYHNDVGNWTSFGSDDPGELVYRVPLSSLP